MGTRKRNKGKNKNNVMPTASKSGAVGKVVDSGFDPKNREVTLMKFGGKFKVIKPATNFTSDLLGEDEAVESFEYQKADSHNQ